MANEETEQSSVGRYESLTCGLMQGGGVNGAEPCCASSFLPAAFSFSSLNALLAVVTESVRSLTDGH
ncbi:Hypothetical predicted protein, partial [Xyrichtys novacula]